MSELDLASELGFEGTNASAVNGEATTDNARKAVKIGEIKRGKLSVIPAITRAGGTGESKYNFSTLDAPGADGFDSDFVEYDPSETVERFSRSVQAAYTKETATAKAEGKPNKYIGRRVVDDAGKLSGIYVIRVDGHDVKGDVEEDEAK